MSHSTESRVALAVTITALAMGMIWIFSEISAESPATENSVWRYTNEGWKELSDVATPPTQTPTGLLDNVSPLVFAAIQLLACITILIGFASDSLGTWSKEKRLTKLKQAAGPRRRVASKV